MAGQGINKATVKVSQTRTNKDNRKYGSGGAIDDYINSKGESNKGGKKDPENKKPSKWKAHYQANK